jgi:hypothetical protein
MPNLNSICGLINNAITSGHFNNRRFQCDQVYGIANQILETTSGELEVIMPTVIDLNGEGTPMVFDDISSFQIFHINTNLNYSIPDSDYGNPGTVMQEDAEMKMIFISQRSKILTTPEQAIAAIILDMPKEFAPSQINALQLSSCVIEFDSVDSNPYELYKNIWQNRDYDLDTDSILFCVNYKIVSTYNSKCFSIC